MLGGFFTDLEIEFFSSEQINKNLEKFKDSIVNELCILVENNNLDEVNLLLCSGRKWSITKALYIAAKNNNLEMVKVLLSSDRNEYTYVTMALNEAVRNSNLEMVKLLLNSGCVVDIKYALSYVIENKNPLIQDELMKFERLKKHQSMTLSKLCSANVSSFFGLRTSDSVRAEFGVSQQTAHRP